MERPPRPSLEDVSLVVQHTSFSHRASRDRLSRTCAPPLNLLLDFVYPVNQVALLSLCCPAPTPFKRAEDAINAAKNRVSASSVASLPEEGRRASLEDVHLNVPKGQLVGVCGAVGCGKSTLLLGILGQLEVRAH